MTSRKVTQKRVEFQRPPKRTQEIRFNSRKVQTFTIPPAAWIYSRYNHLAPEKLFAEFVKNCTLFYWERFGQLLRGEITPVINDDDDVEKSLQTLESQIIVASRELALFGKEYQVCRVVLFLHLYSKIRQCWKQKIKLSSSKDETLGFQIQYRNDMNTIRRAVISYETEQHRLPTLQLWERYIDDYFENGELTRFNFEQCLHIH